MASILQSAPLRYSPMQSTCHVVTDLTVVFNSSEVHSSPERRGWYRLNKELLLHASNRTAWLEVKHSLDDELTADSLVVKAVHVGAQPSDVAQQFAWESRPGGIWLQRSSYDGETKDVVTAVDVLFGTDSVDPRSDWRLSEAPLQLDTGEDVPIARLSVRHGQTSLISAPLLRANKDGKLRIVQISDTHMVTGVGECIDAIDADGKYLPPSVADPLTVAFMNKVLDTEEPDLVILTGDQIHHDVPDSQSALFKVVDPMVKRSIPFVAVFGNHDSEGDYALSRKDQMSILQHLPFSLCQYGPPNVDGVGNYYLEVVGFTDPEKVAATIFLLDSHDQIPSDVQNPDYGWITEKQIDWFTSASQSLRKRRQGCRGNNEDLHLALAFQHIPLPEMADGNLPVKGGTRKEPTEGPSFNSHFFDALKAEGVVALGCGHDHVNDFCARRYVPDAELSSHSTCGPWLCYNGGTGFGGYCSYDGIRYHRRTRIWEIDTKPGGLKAWKRIEYKDERIDEFELASQGKPIS